MADNKQPPEDTYARDSFTFRRMSGGQLRWIAIVIAAIAVIGIIYGMM